MKNFLFVPHVIKTNTVKRLTKNVYDHFVNVCGVNSDDNVFKYYDMPIEF